MSNILGLRHGICLGLASAAVAISPGAPAAGAPAITVQPAAQTVTVGQHALFSVTATNATSYRWFRNGTAINGATQATYVTPAVAVGDTGEQFSVTVTNASGSVTSAKAALSINSAADGGPPASFWGNTGTLPIATQVMTFSFVNRTNGKFPNSQLWWSFSGKTASGQQVKELHSFAEAPTFDMPAINSARMYFYIAADAAHAVLSPTSYYDFIEFNIGRSSARVPWNFDGDTTRVDAFGLKTAIRLHCADGSDITRGEDYGTFLEDRAITFKKYLAETPPQFTATATQAAPFRILEPGAAGFGKGGANANYYQSYLDQVWAANGINPNVVPKPTPFLNLITNQLPDLSAALERHVAEQPGTFQANGKLVNPNFWRNIHASSFYPAGPANFYAKYWHTHGISGLAYGFPYDDVGGYSSNISCNAPTWLVAAIGW
jgi:hypothetical protein